MTNINSTSDIKCIILQQTFTGKRELKVTTTPKPSAPADGEVLIAVKACGINFNDVLGRYGLLEDMPRPPFIPGFECSGEVLDIGTNVTHVDRGDRVVVLTRYSAWAEQIIVKKDLVFKIPKEMSFREAAVLPVAYLTAYILLFEIGNIKPGQTILFHSAGGGVGVALTQLLKLVPNLTIIATASSHKFDALRAHIHYLFEHDIDYIGDVKKIAPEGVDLVLDCMAGDDCERGLALLKFNGKYIMYGTSSLLSWDVKNLFGITKGMSNWWQNDKISCLRLFQDSKSIHGFNLLQLLSRGSNETRRYLADIMHKVFILYKEGKIKPVVDSVFTFEEVNNALGKLIDRKNIGKVVIEPFLNVKSEKVKKPKTSTSNDAHSSSTSGPDDDDNEEKESDDVQQNTTSKS
ncbi:unnamed protein product [Adineta steineri]|uniref:Enoyl reductase (ER) domain-containing protein n=1 Tax=Adineta steineri TaxID=433720 RepID=A0A819G6I0_9BILA|nr:unnamed protein product [Adineta steineri]CAF1409280.1 unnamed protein product [Adineta steineri]CAF3801966.1 unnamed protein product [Adineta steineri]CAF3880982.1 unnamed protein product [Adineta steineri]